MVGFLQESSYRKIILVEKFKTSNLLRKYHTILEIDMQSVAAKSESALSKVYSNPAN